MTSNGNRANPGPADYSIKSKLGESPRWSIKGKYETVFRPNTAPYRALPSSIGQGPKIALASRHKELEGQVTPGPNYVPPALGSDGKKVSMSFRYGTERDARAGNPGPGAYNISPRFANDANKWTLKSRTGISTTDISPGPAAYSPDFTKVKKSAPAASMHIRPEKKASDVTPGPSDYQISRDLAGQRSTMHIRHREFRAENTPGPGQYSPTNANKASTPRYTIGNRLESTNHPNTAPYRALPTTIGEGPKIALSSRHREHQAAGTPGPNYVPPALGSDGKKVSMSFRYGNERDARADNPGPGAYEISPRFANDANKYTLKSRTGISTTDISPGPAAYSPDFTKVKKSAPRASMHIRPKDKGPEQTPGYVDLGSTLHGPSYTIGRRESIDVMPM